MQNQPSLVISTNITSNRLLMKDGWNKVSINFAAGATGTVTPRKYPFSTSQPEAVNIPSPPLAAPGTAVTSTNISFDISGGGELDFVTSGMSGGAVTIMLEWLDD